jgi:hypothetical protein
MIPSVQSVGRAPNGMFCRIGHLMALQLQAHRVGDREERPDVHDLDLVAGDLPQFRLPAVGAFAPGPACVTP